MKEAKIIRSEHIEAVQMGDDLAMLNEETGQYVVLNDMGKIIWEMIDGDTSLEDIIEELLKTYDVEVQVCRSEVTEFVDELIKQEIIRLG